MRITDEVTVAIPSIPVRKLLLPRAIASVSDQYLPARAISVAVDNLKEGAAMTRQRALAGVNTDWTAFLDDDDEFMPHHLNTLMATALDTGADYVFSWFEVVGGVDPFPMNRLLEFDPASPKQTTITILVKTELAKQVGFLRPSEGDAIGGNVWGEDYQFTIECIKAGAKIEQVPDGERTWYWHHDSQNTSGRPDRW